MREWLGHLWAFVVSVLRQWAVLVTGTLIVGLIGVYEHAIQKPISGWPFWSAIIASLFVAFFLAWRKERLIVERSGSSLLPLTPQDLADVFVGRTLVQGNKLATIHLGKWMEVSGLIDNVHEFDFINRLLYASNSVWLVNAPGKAKVFMLFKRKWAKRLSAFVREIRFRYAVRSRALSSTPFG